MWSAFHALFTWSRRTTRTKDHRLSYPNYPQISEIAKSDHIHVKIWGISARQTDIMSWSREHKKLVLTFWKPICLTSTIIASVLVTLLILTLSRFVMISYPRGGPLCAQSILGTVEKMCSLWGYSILRKERRKKEKKKETTVKIVLLVWGLP